MVGVSTIGWPSRVTWWRRVWWVVLWCFGPWCAALWCAALWCVALWWCRALRAAVDLAVNLDPHTVAVIEIRAE